MNLLDRAYSNNLDPKNEANLRVLKLCTLDEKLSKICKSSEMYQAVNKKLDLIRQGNKNPGISDYVHICQVEEECHERSQIAKLSMEVNQIEVEENIIEEAFEPNVIEPDIEWVDGNVNHISSHDFNEYQNEDSSQDRNYQPWNDEEYGHQNFDTYEVPNQIHDDGGNRSKSRYHHVSQAVRFRDDQSRTKTNVTPCLSCNGAGYISAGGYECNELQVLADCSKQISVPFDEDIDENPEESM